MQQQCLKRMGLRALARAYFVWHSSLSMFLLSLATRTVPIGTAYAIWVGIGAIGTTAYGMVVLGEDYSVLRILCFVLILTGVVGLKLLSSNKS